MTISTDLRHRLKTALGSGAGHEMEALIDAGEFDGESMSDDAPLYFGTSLNVGLMWSTGDASNPATVLFLGDSNQALHITDKGARATDWNVSADTHPTVYIHSNTTPATDYLLVGAHDGTTALIDVVGGTTLSLKIAGTAAATVTSAGLNLPAGQDVTFVGTTGQCQINITDNLADSLSICEGSNDYIVFVTTDSGEKVQFKQVLEINGAHDLSFSGTTGQCQIVLTDNLADALSIKISGGNDLAVFTTTDSGELMTVPTTFKQGATAADLAAIKGHYDSGTIAVTVPSITDPDIAKVDVDVSAMTFVPAVGDGVIAIPLVALPTNCRFLGAQVVGTDSVQLTFGSEGGSVTGAAKNFKFLFFDLT